MATAVQPASDLLTGRRRLLRDTKRVRQHVLVYLDAAAQEGRVRNVGFFAFRKIAIAAAKIAADATDQEQDSFIADCCQDGDGTGIELFRGLLVDELGGAGGGFIDIIMQLLPILLPLIIGCFA